MGRWECVALYGGNVSFFSSNGGSYTTTNECTNSKNGTVKDQGVGHG